MATPTTTPLHTPLSSNAVDSFEPKTMVTRKLRRRPHDPLPAVEKRRKPTPLSSLVYVLDEGEVDEDLKVIFKVRGQSTCQQLNVIGPNMYT